MYVRHLFALALFLQSTNLMYCTLIIWLSPFIHEYTLIYINPYYPRLAKVIDTLVHLVYLAAVSVIFEEAYCGIISPLLTYLISTMKYIWNGLLNSSGFGQDTGNIAGSSGPSNNGPSPNPGPSSVNPVVSDPKEDDKKLEKFIYRYTESVRVFTKHGSELGDKQKSSMRGLNKYVQHLSDEDKIVYENTNHPVFPKIVIVDDMTVQEYWLHQREVNNVNWNWLTARMELWERNSKEIKLKLGGKKSSESKIFIEHLNNFKESWSFPQREKERVIKSQLGEAAQFDKLLKKKGMRCTDIMEAYKALNTKK